MPTHRLPPNDSALVRRPPASRKPDYTVMRPPSREASCSGSRALLIHLDRCVCSGWFGEAPSCACQAAVLSGLQSARPRGCSASLLQFPERELAAAGQEGVQDEPCLLGQRVLDETAG